MSFFERGTPMTVVVMAQDRQAMLAKVVGYVVVAADVLAMSMNDGEDRLGRRLWPMQAIELLCPKHKLELFTCHK